MELRFFPTYFPLAFSWPRVHSAAPLGSVSAFSLAKGPFRSTLRHGSGPFLAQGSISQHPWARFRPFSWPRVHSGAPLGTISTLFLSKGPSRSTLGLGSGPFLGQGSIPQHPWAWFRPFSWPRVHPAAPLGSIPAFCTNGRARGEPLGGVAPRSAQPPEVVYSGGGATSPNLPFVHLL